jgi:periplasmic protein TonB
MQIMTALLLLAPASPPAAAPPPPIISAPSPPPPMIVPSPLIVQPPPAPPPPAKVLRPPEPRRPAQAYVTRDDYPASALRMGAEGRVAFTLDVGPNGCVHGCTITRSSGSSALDSATCAIMVRRARFTPAIDSHGNPASGRARQEIEWRLPVPAERG